MRMTLRFDLYASKRDLHLTASVAKRKTRFPSVREGTRERCTLVRRGFPRLCGTGIGRYPEADG